MLVVVPLSALTDHTPKAPELLSGLITPLPLPPARLYTPPSPRALRQLVFVFPTYNLRRAKVRQIPALLNIRKLPSTSALNCSERDLSLLY